MNQILTFQLDSISLNAGAPENSSISRNASISEDFEVHGVLQFSLSNLLRRQEQICPRFWRKSKPLSTKRFLALP